MLFKSVMRSGVTKLQIAVVGAVILGAILFVMVGVSEVVSSWNAEKQISEIPDIISGQPVILGTPEVDSILVYNGSDYIVDSGQFRIGKGIFTDEEEQILLNTEDGYLILGATNVTGNVSVDFPTMGTTADYAHFVLTATDEAQVISSAVTLSGAITASGALSATGGITLLTTGGTASTMTAYEDIVHTTNWAGALATAAVVRLVRRDNQVTMYIKGVAATMSNAVLSFATVLPTRFRPADPVALLIPILNSASLENGQIGVSTAGAIAIGVFNTAGTTAVDVTAFTAAAGGTFSITAGWNVLAV